MIWLWIVAALFFSILPLINKKIDIAYYIWLLIPIDSYGISVLGATIKPYMLFAFIIPVILYARNKQSSVEFSATKGQLLAGAICIMMLTVSIINTQSFTAIRTSVMALIVYLCAQLSASSSRCDKSEQLSDVFIASSFGLATVYLIAYFCMQGGLTLDGIIAYERAEPGLFMCMSNMVDGAYTEAFRLRGFAYDPNAMFLPFIFGISACVSRLFKKLNLYYILTLIMSVLCIILSSSRMGLLCCILTIAISCVVNIAQFSNIKKKILSIIGAISLCTVAVIVAMSSFGQQVLSNLLSTYSNRSSLTDEYGRFSIWEDCLNIYWEKNPFAGVGLGQMSELTETSRMTHNTWLQFICECGIIVGGIAVIYFMSVAVIGWAKTKANCKNHPGNSSYLALVIGYTMTIVSLISVDNITSSYLWFTALLILKMAQYAKTKTIKPVT